MVSESTCPNTGNISVFVESIEADLFRTIVREGVSIDLLVEKAVSTIARYTGSRHTDEHEECRDFLKELLEEKVSQASHCPPYSAIVKFALGSNDPETNFHLMGQYDIYGCLACLPEYYGIINQFEGVRNA